MRSSTCSSTRTNEEHKNTNLYIEIMTLNNYFFTSFSWFSFFVSASTFWSARGSILHRRFRQGDCHQNDQIIDDLTIDELHVYLFIYNETFKQKKHVHTYIYRLTYYICIILNIIIYLNILTGLYGRTNINMLYNK